MNRHFNEKIFLIFYIISYFSRTKDREEPSKVLLLSVMNKYGNELEQQSDGPAIIRYSKNDLTIITYTDDKCHISIPKEAVTFFLNQ